MKAVLYARYSTEKQSGASIEDQHRVCTRLAERHGLRVVARFSDAAISGGTAERPGYQALLAAARRHEFDVIVAEDTSRLWRNLAEQAPRLAELADLGIDVVTHDLDTRTESAGMISAVLGASSEAYRKEIGRRTRRGLEGRARQGLPAGGHSYGYVPAARSTTARVEIDEAEAEVVRRIFTMYAEGKSPRGICDALNRDRIPAPGSSWARTERRRKGWVASVLNGDGKAGGTGILRNPIYAGQVIWNRTHWVRSATNSQKRRCIPNPPSEWIVRQDERLRIVPRALWERVRGRLSERAHEVGERVRRGLSRSAANHTGRSPSRYLLSGLLHCSECGAVYTIAGAAHYGCSTYLHGGTGGCSNSARLHREKAEAGVLAGVQRLFLDPAVLEEAKRRARALIRARTAQPAQPDAQRRRELQARIENLADAVAQGALRASPSIAAKLREAEEELASLEAQASAQRHADIELLIPQLAEELERAVRELPKTLAAGNVDLARQELKGYLGSIRVVAEPTRMRLYSERNAVEVALKRAVGGMASINGSGGRICHPRSHFLHSLQRAGEVGFKRCPSVNCRSSACFRRPPETKLSGYSCL
ncbi:MAG TPA: recombinase family protein [Steroidobacteraceae bacterium]|nr:recombinase family protein [Steroidobacteraceae bacterium]